MQEIWRIVAEILVEPGDTASGSTKGFMNITTWADSAEAASAKIADYLGTFKWRVISIEDASRIDENQDYGEQIEDMIDRTRSDPNAIILGTFHGYKEN
jgi:hypothetical protein